MLFLADRIPPPSSVTVSTTVVLDASCEAERVRLGKAKLLVCKASWTLYQS